MPKRTNRRSKTARHSPRFKVPSSPATGVTAGTGARKRPGALHAGAESPSASVETSLPTQNQVQDRFNRAVAEGISPCLWIPPYWAELATTNGKREFANNSQDQEHFDIATTETKDEIKARLDAGQDKDKKHGETPKSPDAPPDDNAWTHPFADTSHIDDTAFSENDRRALKPCLDANPHVQAKLNRILGPDSPGMKRLERIFEWTLYRASVLMKDLNDALKGQAQGDYETARQNYIYFLRDLDDHEPELAPQPSPKEVAKEILLRVKRREPSSLPRLTGKTKADIEKTLFEPLNNEFKNEGRALMLAKALTLDLIDQEGKGKGAAKVEEVLNSKRPVKLNVTDKAFPSGYGRSIKWACIDPVIFGGKIIGTRIVAKWNPHISSSGVPIQHD